MRDTLSKTERRFLFGVDPSGSDAKSEEVTTDTPTDQNQKKKKKEKTTHKTNSSGSTSKLKRSSCKSGI